MTGKEDKSLEFSANNQLQHINADAKWRTAEQKRNILGMLDKSLAREIYLEKKLSELRQSEEQYYLDEVKIVVSAWDCMIMLSLLINFLFNRTPPPSPFAVSRNYYGRPNEKLISGSFLSTKA